MATNENVTWRQSTIGRKPEPAAPMAMPVIALSAIGVGAHPLLAELLEQRRDRVGGHVEDRLVLAHLLGDRFEAALRVSLLSHESGFQVQSAKISSSAACGLGKALASEKATERSMAASISASIVLHSSSLNWPC